MRGRVARLALAALFGLVTAALVFGYLRRPVEPQPAEALVPVVIAARSIEAGTLLTADDLEVVHWPQSVNLPGGLQSTAEAVDLRSSVAMMAGQPLLSHQLRTREQVGPAAVIPPGMRLITISVNERTSIGYRLRQGDRVDIISVIQRSDGLTSELVLQGIEVYALGEELQARSTTNSEPKTVTLLVTPEEALMISLLAEEKAIRITLRAIDDLEPVKLEPVRLPK